MCWRPLSASGHRDSFGPSNAATRSEWRATEAARSGHGEAPYDTVNSSHFLDLEKYQFLRGGQNSEALDLGQFLIVVESENRGLLIENSEPAEQSKIIKNGQFDMHCDCLLA
jgi:hypothetical protein